MGIFDVMTMLQALDNTPRPLKFLLELLLGNRFTTFPTESVVIDMFKGKRRMAPFVSPLRGGKLMEREGHSAQTYRTPLIQPRDVLTPERLKNRMAGENVVSSKTPAERAVAENAAIANLFDDFITRREEWMLAQLIYGGSIHMVGDGVDELYSIGFDNFEVLSGADKWDTSTANPLADIGKWRRGVQQSTGITPNAAIMGSDVADVLLAHESVKSMLDVRRMEMGTINPSQLPNGATYIGSLAREGMDLYEYNEWFVDDATGNTLPMVPAGKIAIVPTADRNPGAQMLYGSFTEMDPAPATTYEGARIPRNWTEKGPNAEFIEIVSRPLPVMPDVDSWFVGTVI